MQLRNVNYAVVGTLFSVAVFSVYPVITGKWMFAFFSIPFGSLLGFGGCFRFLRKYNLPVTATCGEVEDRMKKEAISKD
ncbi:hypothetical protein SAMN05216374_5941 [Tardiphaga sp. OK246]|nr:hypothetical protein SAMN05216374_5941 [Tardiphaga sp. OK246]